MAEPLDLVVIGCGGIAQAYLQAQAQVPDLRLCAVVDTDTGRRDQTAAKFEVPAFGDLQDLLQKLSRLPQAALVLTPPNTHEALATALLQAGIHVLCEKPLAPTVAAAERMIGEANRAGRLLMMGSKFRYTPDIAKAKALVEQGVIGDVLMFENVFCSRVDMTRRWNSVRAVAGGGVLIDNGSHSVDIARFLIGPVLRVQAQFARKVQPIEVEDTARLLFEAAPGTVGAVDLSWSLHKEVPSYVRLYGNRGTLEVGWKLSRYKLDGQSDWVAFGKGYDKIESFRSQLQNFAASIRGSEPPLITHRDALASVQVIEAAYRSAQEHKWHTTG